MQQGYLKTHKPKFSYHSLVKKEQQPQQKNNKLQLPSLVSKIEHKVTQKSLALQIQNIDASLKNKNFRYFHGLLFENVTGLTIDKIATSLRDALRHQSLILEDGFSIWGNSALQQQNKDFHEVNNKKHRLSDKIETFSEKMVNLSLKNVYDYDLKKYLMIMKTNKSRWSMYKRNNEINPENISSLINSDLEGINYPITIQKKHPYHPRSKNPISSLQSVSQTVAQLQSSVKNPQSKNSNTKVTKSKGTAQKKSRLSHISGVSPSPKKYIVKSITEAAQEPSQKNQEKISKYELKNMLAKQLSSQKNGRHMIAIWLPPASYPQFYGLLVYSLAKKLSVCRITKYFLFRRSLSTRFFQSIIQQISARQDKYIQAIQMIANKSDYAKIYEPYGWKMKSMQSINKIRIKFIRIQH